MERSDWIALAACIAAFLGLIPSYYPLFKRQKQKEVDYATISEIPVTNDDTNTVSEKEKADVKEMPPMLRMLGLTVTAVVVFLIELIIFSIIAHFSKVKVDLNTMTLSWKISFYSLFVIPGLFLLFAFLIFTTMFED